MKKKLLFLLIMPLVFINLTGCAPLIVGAAAGALGAKALSKDAIQGDTDKTYDSLWSSALMVANMRGIIKQENSSTGYIQLESGNSLVNIRLMRLTRATTRLRVSARKYHFPNASLAEEIFVKIMEQAQ